MLYFHHLWMLWSSVAAKSQQCAKPSAKSSLVSASPASTRASSRVSSRCPQAAQTILDGPIRDSSETLVSDSSTISSSSTPRVASRGVRLRTQIDQPSWITTVPMLRLLMWMGALLRRRTTVERLDLLLHSHVTYQWLSEVRTSSSSQQVILFTQWKSDLEDIWESYLLGWCQHSRCITYLLSWRPQLTS